MPAKGLQVLLGVGHITGHCNGPSATVPDLGCHLLCCCAVNIGHCSKGHRGQGRWQTGGGKAGTHSVQLGTPLGHQLGVKSDASERMRCMQHHAQIWSPLNAASRH